MSTKTPQPAPSRKKAADPSLPFIPAHWELHHAKALQKLAAGEANAEEQKRALDWIIYAAAQTYDNPFRPGGSDGDRNTAFACGRKFVGEQIVKLIKVDLLALQQQKE